jgi:O-antigen ligase/polysaccharide polymerase Wzy-like membrane protein/tetratricopeptide repeat protein
VMGGAAVALVVLAGALLAILFSPLRLLNGDPGPARLHLWPDAVRMIAARPLTGWGEDATGLEFGRFFSGNWSPQVDRAHSGPLDIAATQGILGLVALAWVFFTWGRGVWRWRSSATVGPLAAACIGYSVWVLFNFDWAPATGVFWLLAGTAWSGVRALEAREGQAGERRPRAVGLRSLGATALAVAVVWFGVMPVLADIWYSQNRPDLSVIVDPLQGKYHWALGQSLVAVGSPTRGLNQMQLAAKLGESDPQLYIDTGDAERTLGRPAEARAAYLRALEIDPFNVTARRRLAGIGAPPSG